MPDLSTSLQGHDLGHLRILAENWHIELTSPDARSAIPELVSKLLDRNLVLELVSTLPDDARLALDDLIHNHGRLPWALFSKRHGTVRAVGPGKRDRERPDRTPISASEVLLYRALIARAFFDTDEGPEEYAYIPDDLLEFLPYPRSSEEFLFVRPASRTDRKHVILSTDAIVDDACTLLAALRVNLTEQDLSILKLPECIPWKPLYAILMSGDLIDGAGYTQSDRVRSVLEMPRSQAFMFLAQAWLHSSNCNDLHLIPGLIAEGEWHNNPLRTRQTVLNFMLSLPDNNWWSISSFVQAIYHDAPDFQRPMGDYDSWYLRDAESGEYLQGFENWDKVDGALLRYLITGPFHWCGFVDLASPDEGVPPAAFRRSKWWQPLLEGKHPEDLPLEDETIRVGSDARILAPRLVPRSARYQLSRFCEWMGIHADAYRYRITPSSLTKARHQELKVQHLLGLLRKYADAIPPGLVKALERWETRGTEARFENVLVLRLSSPELLQTLRQSRAARFLGDPLGPTSVIVRGNAEEKVRTILAELGILAESSWKNDVL